MIWKNFYWSDQPEQQPDGVSHSAHGWMHVDGFVVMFKNYRTETVTPSEFIVDEEMVCWYGQGGACINLGLPIYIAIDRKPKNGADIQNSVCDKSGVMLRLKVVKSEENDED